VTVDSSAPVASIAVATHSAEDTRNFAAALAAVAWEGDRIALLGPLGAGKTQFAKGFARGLGVTDVVNSPSFTLMTEYAGRLPLFHQDLYRISGAEEAMAGGLVDERQAEGITLSEWAERLPDEIDPNRVTVAIEVLTDDDRTLTITTSRPDQLRYLDAAQRWAADDSRAADDS
jgi:tRNA threonylcarbamoyladenosine biosynthesis protein TsaE